MRGRAGEFGAQALELTAETIRISMLNQFGAGAPDETVYDRVLHSFQTGATIKVPVHEIQMRADVVQVSRSLRGREDRLELTCRFRRPLDKAQCDLLGITRAGNVSAW